VQEAFHGVRQTAGAALALAEIPNVTTPLDHDQLQRKWWQRRGLASAPVWGTRPGPPPSKLPQVRQLCSTQQLLMQGVHQGMRTAQGWPAGSRHS
jgi:hypothetical protein